MKQILHVLLFLIPLFSGAQGLIERSGGSEVTPQLKVNAHGYFEMPGLNVMVFFDIYPEGHQGGVGIIQNGTRVATNGDRHDRI